MTDIQWIFFIDSLCFAAAIGVGLLWSKVW